MVQKAQRGRKTAQQRGQGTLSREAQLATGVRKRPERGAHPEACLWPAQGQWALPPNGFWQDRNLSPVPFVQGH